MTPKEKAKLTQVLLATTKAPQLLTGRLKGLGYWAMILPASAAISNFTEESHWHSGQNP